MSNNECACLTDSLEYAEPVLDKEAEELLLVIKVQQTVLARWVLAFLICDKE
jgi:hypothetical protein